MTNKPGVTLRHQSQSLGNEEAVLAAISVPPHCVALIWHPDMGYRLMTPTMPGDADVPPELLAITECFMRVSADEGGHDELVAAFLARTKGAA
jgi:hypothetical protein